MTEIRFSLTPRLVALGLVSLLALFVLLFLLGMQMGQRVGRTSAAESMSGTAAPATNPIADAQKKLADAEASAKAAPAQVVQTATPPVPTAPAAARP